MFHVMYRYVCVCCSMRWLLVPEAVYQCYGVTMQPKYGIRFLRLTYERFFS